MQCSFAQLTDSRLKRTKRLKRLQRWIECFISINELAGKAWMLTRKVNTRIEPYLVGLKKFKSNDSSPLIAMIKEKGIEI